MTVHLCFFLYCADLLFLLCYRITIQYSKGVRKGGLVVEETVAVSVIIKDTCSFEQYCLVLFVVPRLLYGYYFLNVFCYVLLIHIYIW